MFEQIVRLKFYVSDQISLTDSLRMSKIAMPNVKEIAREVEICVKTSDPFFMAIWFV